MSKQPTSALASPRFCNMGTFMRMEKVNSAQGLDFVIVGAPFDTGSSFRSGSRFGPNAIRNISVMMKPNNVLQQVNIMEELKGGDIGDFNIVPGYIHPTYKFIETGITEIIEKGAIPITLGGDHSITLAELRSVAKKYGPVALVHFDSHSDLCDEVFGEKYNHGTPFRRAIEEGLIDTAHSIQIGMRGSLYDPNEHKIAAELGMLLIPAHEVHQMGMDAIIKMIKERVGTTHCFLTFDIDFVDPAYAPGTGTPEVGGFTSHETLTILRNLTELNYVGFDVVEVLPAFDSGEITAYLAANIVFEFLSILAVKKKNKKK